MTRTFLAYLAERVRPGLFVPVLAGLWVSALWASGATRFDVEHAVPLLLMALLVLQFRLWDDLEDVERDRRVHPDRILVRSPLKPFRRLLVIVAVIALAISATTGRSVLAGVLALDVTFVAAYRVIRPRLPDVFWRFPVLLAKYPAFVLLTTMAIGAAPGRRVAIATMVVMSSACLYEAVHHGQQPTGVAS